MSDEQTEKFKQGLFSLSPSRFGKVTELLSIGIISKVLKKHLDKVHVTTRYDLVDENQTRYECKFSRAFTHNEQPITKDNVFECVMENSSSMNKCVAHSISVENFNCIYAQIKPAEFDVFIYGICFEDCVKLYMATSEQVQQMSWYSNKQHRNSTDEGQFHITRKDLPKHADYYLTTIDYNTVCRVLQQL